MALTRIINNFGKSIGILRTFQRNASKICSTFIPEFENHPDISNYDDLYSFSLKKSDEFWGTLARSRLTWQKPFEVVSDCNLNDGRTRWFEGGQINAAGKLNKLNPFKFFFFNSVNYFLAPSVKLQVHILYKLLFITSYIKGI